MLKFGNEYIAGLAEGTMINIEYKATINTNALTANPVNNSAYLSHGNNDDIDSTPVVKTDVYNAKFTETKKDGYDAPLAGAGFVIRNAENKYYRLEDNVVSWVDSIDDATEYRSNDNGEVTAFIGLANGTYTLIEKTVPAGYNKAADSMFTVAEHDYTVDNLEQAAEVTNNAGIELSETGGMGTQLFYIIGGIMDYIEIPAIDLTLSVYHGTNSCIPRGILRNCKLPKRNK